MIQVNRISVDPGETVHQVEEVVGSDTVGEFSEIMASESTA